jgi:hypothetical protein
MDRWRLASRSQGPAAFRGVSRLSAPLHRGASLVSVALWRPAHPSVEVVCRDRSRLFAEGIRHGAPQAVQVVDRFHLVQNLGEALERFFLCYRRALNTLDASLDRSSEPTPTLARLSQARHTRWARLYHRIRQLHAQHLGIAAISRHVQVSRPTVYRYLATPRRRPSMLSLIWSNGLTEGFIHRLKLIKRQAYERAGVDFLRHGILPLSAGIAASSSMRSGMAAADRSIMEKVKDNLGVCPRSSDEVHHLRPSPRMAQPQNYGRRFLSRTVSRRRFTPISMWCTKG